MLRDHFSQFGHVSLTDQLSLPPSIITDVFVPRPFRSFAFITFEDSDVAASLLGQDQVINGQTLTVGSAVPKMPASTFMHHGGPGGAGLGHGHQQLGHGGPHGNPHGPPGGPGGHGSMMHNMYPISAAHGGPQGIPWSGWSHPFGTFGAYGEETNGPQSPRTRYNGPSMMAGINPSAVSTAAALTSQYTRAHQNQGGGYLRQRSNGQTGGAATPYQNEDTAIATLNILNNPTVVAAIVNAAKNEALANGGAGSTQGGNSRSA
ncbi:unnamed protein product [Rodentolepis nana]|uniref:RRM domain-containing protein n=1 Tax=Rodentolepis nana TaxID=102285 RepID=A0A158QJ73_RODNA|nr:unnamed protein product [Rodentolepis nana]